jgi:phospholipid-translocating ATPase
MDDDNTDHPVAFCSRKLLHREEKYSAVEKECLAIRVAVKVFKVYLLGRHFIIQTDNHALEWLARIKDKNARLTHWSLALQPYDFNVVYRKGTANRNVDGLSCLLLRADTIQPRQLHRRGRGGECQGVINFLTTCILILDVARQV